MKTKSDDYDMFVAKGVDYDEIAAMDIDAIASDICELIGGDGYGPGDYPRDEDGLIDVYAIARMVQEHAQECAQDAEADRWEEHQRIYNR